MCYTELEILFQPRDRKGGSTVISFFTDLFRAEQEVREYWQKERWRQTRNIAILSIALFLMMSVMNLYQRSYGMLLTTLTGAIALIVCLLVGRRRQNTLPVELVCFVLLLVLFTGYILLGGNDGFAALWVVVVPLMFMMLLNVKLGILISGYFLLLLFLTFYGPLDNLLRYDYPPMIRLRFPLLYLGDCVLSLYCVHQIFVDRSNLIETQRRLRVISFEDATTGLQNRAAYSHYQQTADFQGVGQLAVVFIDVNGLHELNNRLGHRAGDEMLCFVGRQCVSQFPEAKVFRLGGDEFLLVLERMEQCRIQEGMEALDARVQGAGYSIAYGIEFRSSGFDLESMVIAADNKMLGAKAEHYKNLERRRH